MALLAQISGDVLLLRYMLNNTTQADCEYHLYTNNKTPAATDGLNNYTESVASNYTGYRLLGSQWTVSSGVSAGATATYAVQNFNFSAADTIYGYFATSLNKAVLLWAEIFTGGPFVLPSSGGTIALTPRISLT